MSVFKQQVEPPGLYMVQLPFLDDIRTPETEPNWVGEGHPTADKVAVDAAADMIAALAIPDFYSGCLPNPSLQRHYQVGISRRDISSWPPSLHVSVPVTADILAALAIPDFYTGCPTPRCSGTTR